MVTVKSVGWAIAETHDRDELSLVLIHGSNLDAPLGGASVNLTNWGLQRHHILWARDMDEHELRRGGAGEPTVNRIDVAAFDSLEKLREWLSLAATAFVKGRLVEL